MGVYLALFLFGASPPPPVASDLPPLELVAEDLSGTAREAELLAIVPDGEAVLAREMHSSGGLRYLAASTLAPNCSLPFTGLLDESNARILVTCFFDQLPALLEDSGEDPRAVAWDVDSVRALGDDGTQVIKIGQRVGRYRVKGGRASIVVRQGRIHSYQGRLFPPSLIPDAEPAGLFSDHVADAADADRYFDPERQAFLRVTDLTGTVAETVVVDDATGVEVDRFIATDNWNQVSKLTTVGRYQDEFFDTLAPAPTTQTVYMSVDYTSGGTHSYCLDWGSEDDAGPAFEDGEPFVSFCLGVNDNCSGMRCEVYSSPATPIFTGFGMTANNTSTNGRLANVHFWTHDLATFAKHVQGGYKAWFDWHGFDSENFKVVVPTGNPCSGGGVACAFRTGLPLSTTEFRIVLPLNTSNQSTANLKTIAHEYGHVMHYMYDFGAVIDFNTPSGAVREGFADANVLRYAMYRGRNVATRVHDSGFVLNYVKDRWGQGDRDHRIQNGYSNGEGYPAYLPNVTADPENLTYEPWDSASPCYGTDFSADNKKYKCGSLLGIIFWALAHNQVRVHFNGTTPGTPILTTSGWNWIPETPAGAAYTYAVATIGGDETVQDFFNQVSSWYWAQMNAGNISGTEYGKISNVLTTHCVGWSAGTCTQWHKTAWQGRPAALTGKATFAGGQTEQFIRAEDMARTGTPFNHGFGTTENPPMGYMNLNSSDDMLCTPVYNFGAAGTFSVHLAAWVGGASSDTIQVRVDNGSWWDWQISGIGYGSWGWNHTGPNFSLSAGNHSYCIRHKENMFVDAMLMRRES